MTIELPKRVAENIDRFSGRTWLLAEMASEAEVPHSAIVTPLPATARAPMKLAGGGCRIPLGVLIRSKLDGLRTMWASGSLSALH
jgi:hypothetical protein